MVLGSCPGHTTLNKNGLLLKADDKCFCHWSRYNDKVLMHSICDGRYVGWKWSEVAA